MRSALPRPVIALAAAAAFGLALTLALAPGGGERTRAEAGQYLRFSGPGDGYIEAGNDPALKPTAAITWEAWVLLDSYGSANPGESCVTIAGQNYFAGTWFGLCDGRPRFYVQAQVYIEAGGAVPLGQWTHVAVTYDGAEVTFYINGAVNSHLAHAGAMSVTSDPLRIGSDVYWPRPPDGGLDEVRLWGVARSESDIFAAMNVTITTPQAGLVAAWNMDGSADADVGGFSGTLAGDASFAELPPTPSPTPGPYRKGDIDCNGSINARDALPIIAFAAGTGEEPGCTNDPTNGDAADIDCSGALGATDALALLRAIAPVAAGLPEGCDSVGTQLS